MDDNTATKNSKTTELIQKGTYAMRQENRRYMWRQTRRVVKYGLMTAGAIAIYKTVKTDNCDHEETY